ncbi:MAG TPA: hypothetical protein VJO32_03420 [Ktedonobacteraceae bacterium]|nr:hypothetical protein [Ktedonobacteraceae bacterium]
MNTLAYRLWQVRQQLGFAPPLTSEERFEVARWLPETALSLFESMSHADQRHSLRVCQGLQARGCSDKEMLAAALLHDVGKAEGRVPFWTRPVIVLGKRCAPRLLARLAVYPRAGQAHWRRSLSNAWWHAEIGADMAAAAGLSERAVLYIRTHHQPNGPAAELHLVDEAS